MLLHLEHLLSTSVELPVRLATGRLTLPTPRRNESASRAAYSTLADFLVGRLRERGDEVVREQSYKAATGLRQ